MQSPHGLGQSWRCLDGTPRAICQPDGGLTRLQLWRGLTLLVFFLVPSARAIVLVGVESMELTVDGVQRAALVYVPKLEPDKTVPLVFVRHGQGGKSAQAIGGFGINRF